MATNVLEELATKKSLLDRLTSNAQVTSMTMATLQMLLVTCTERSVPAAGVTIDPIRTQTVNGNRNLLLKARAHFHELAIGSTAAIWRPQDDFTRYLGFVVNQKAAMLHSNKSVMNYLTSLLTTIDQFAEYRHIPFDKIVVKQQMLEKGTDMLVVKIGKFIGYQQHVDPTERIL